MLNQQKFGWPNKVFRLNMDQWKFLLIQQIIFLGVIMSLQDILTSHGKYADEHAYVPPRQHEFFTFFQVAAWR